MSLNIFYRKAFGDEFNIFDDMRIFSFSVSSFFSFGKYNQHYCGKFAQ